MIISASYANAMPYTEELFYFIPVTVVSHIASSLDLKTSAELRPAMNKAEQPAVVQNGLSEKVKGVFR